MSDHQAFWEDLRHDLEDPEFAREHAEVTALVQTLDQLVCNDE